jgi:hypothetical protein
MTNYIQQAQQHVNQIRYYHQHGGENGYSQAVYDYHQLDNLAQKAYQSKKHKNESSIISEMKQGIEILMEEMKNRMLKQ